MEEAKISELKYFNFGTNINPHAFFGTITKKLKENDLSSLETLSFLLDKQKTLIFVNIILFFLKVVTIRLWKFQRLFVNVV